MTLPPPAIAHKDKIAGKSLINDNCVRKIIITSACKNLNDIFHESESSLELL